MDELTSEPSRAVSTARAHLDAGFRFEESGALERSLDAYQNALNATTSPVEKAEAHLRIARVHCTRAEWARCREESTEAVRLAESVGATDLAAEALNVEVAALQSQGCFDDADAIAHRALTLATSPRVRGMTLQNLGRSAAERRDFAAAESHFDASFEGFREANDERGLALALVTAARAALDRGDAARSIEMGHEAIAITRRLNSLNVLLAAVQSQLAAFMAQGRLDLAEGLLTEALGHFTTARSPIRQAECLELMGELGEHRRDWEAAARCYRRAAELARRENDQPLTERLTGRITTATRARRAHNLGVR